MRVLLAVLVSSSLAGERPTAKHVEIAVLEGYTQRIRERREAVGQRTAEMEQMKQEFDAEKPTSRAEGEKLLAKRLGTGDSVGEGDRVLRSEEAV